MKLNQKIVLILFFLGLIFSSMIRICFNLENGYVFQQFWFRLIPYPIFDYTVGGSSQTCLTSTFSGYIFFLAAGIYWLVTTRRKLPELLVTIAFLALTMYALYFEGNTLLLDRQNEFTGQHMRIGPLLFIIGLVMLFRGRKAAIKNKFN